MGRLRVITWTRIASRWRFHRAIDQYCDKFESRSCAYRYYKTGIMPCNWKVGQGFFNEFYHVQQSIRSCSTYVGIIRSRAPTAAMARCGNVSDNTFPYKRSSRLPPEARANMRGTIIGISPSSTTSWRDGEGRAYRALDQLRALPPEMDGHDILAAWGKIMVEQSLKDGAGWPMEADPRIHRGVASRLADLPNAFTCTAQSTASSGTASAQRP